MKAPSRHKSSLSGLFRQVSRVGLTLQLRGTAPSDEDGLFNATARDRRRGCLRCNSRENHGSDGVPFLHEVLLSTIISLNLRGVALHRCSRAIAQRESLVDTTELERHKLADARSMLKSLSRIASSQGKRAAYDAELQPGQLERLGSEASRSWLWRCGDLHPASNCAGTFFPVALVKIITAHSKGIARDGTHR